MANHIQVDVAVSYTLFMINRGKLTLSQAQVSDLFVAQAPLLMLNGLLASCILNEVSLFGIDVSELSTGLILVGDGASLCLSGCEIENVTMESNAMISFSEGRRCLINNTRINSLMKESMNGTMMVAELGSGNEMMITNSSVSQCTIGEGGYCGGGMIVMIRESGMMHVIDSSITECEVCGRDGRGGGLFISLDERYVNGYQLTNIDFSANEALFGKDVYLQAPNLRMSATRSRFSFALVDSEVHMNGCDGDEFVLGINEANLLDLWAFTASSVFVSESEGIDRLVCGAEQSPCKTIDFGMTRLE
jgi:hypothetical protein